MLVIYRLRSKRAICFRARFLLLRMQPLISVETTQHSITTSNDVGRRSPAAKQVKPNPVIQLIVLRRAILLIVFSFSSSRLFSLVSSTSLFLSKTIIDQLEFTYAPGRGNLPVVNRPLHDAITLIINAGRCFDFIARQLIRNPDVAARPQ